LDAFCTVGGIIGNAVHSAFFGYKLYFAGGFACVPLLGT
jgi:hypothetical protein